ncbi:MAG: hypothetical protein MJE66_22355 [Proteobacteria bacterium]|nr:hypothetical protein [Pseudomonadota bacterium]
MAAKTRKQGTATRATGKSGWGGARPGAGRPKGSGTGRSKTARYNRISVMVNDAELARLRSLARRRRIPLGTLAYELLVESLKHQR